MDKTLKPEEAAQVASDIQDTMLMLLVESYQEQQAIEEEAYYDSISA